MKAARVVALGVTVLLFAATFAVAQEFVDVVYLKNGSVVRGTITAQEVFPEKSITIETADGSTFVFKEDEIDKITQERATARGKVARAAGDSPMSSQSLEINLLGLLQFGPYLRYHIGLGNEMFISPYIRVGYLGAIYYLLDWSPEVGLGVCYLAYWPLGVGANRFYSGGLFEFNMLDYDNPDVPGIALAGNFGVRWRTSGSTSFWQTGLIAGVGYDFYYEEATFFGMFELSWGWEL